MTVDKLIDELRDRSAETPAGSRERVWNRLARPVRTSPSALKLLVAGSAAFAAGIAVTLWLSTPAPLTGDGFVVAGQRGSRFTAEGPHSVALNRGAATWSVWSGRLTVHAGRHVATAEAAVFALEVAGDRVALDLREGELMLDGERLKAPLKRGAVEADVPAVHGLEPVSAPDVRAWSQAEGALAAQDVEGAVKRFAAIGASGSLRAEAGLLRTGELELRRLDRALQARGTFDALLVRFPKGALRQEAHLSGIEASVKLRDWRQVIARGAAFNSEFPANERSAEVAWLQAEALWQTGETSRACGAIGGLDVARGGALATALRARCEKP